MIWIGIVIGLVIGYFIGTIIVEEKIRKIFGNGKFVHIMSDGDCEKSRSNIIKFLRGRNCIKKGAACFDSKMECWEKLNDMRVIDTFAGDYVPEMYERHLMTGKDWLENFIRLVDAVQCYIVIADKRIPEDRVVIKKDIPTEPRSH